MGQITQLEIESNSTHVRRFVVSVSAHASNVYDCLKLLDRSTCRCPSLELSSLRPARAGVWRALVSESRDYRRRISEKALSVSVVQSAIRRLARAGPIFSGTALRRLRSLRSSSRGSRARAPREDYLRRVFLNARRHGSKSHQASRANLHEPRLRSYRRPN